MLRYNRLFPWLVCGLGALFYCYEYLLRILPSVMSEHLFKLFNINGLAFGNLMGFYYYAYTPMQLPVGILMDRIRPRYLLAWACVVCALGTYLFTYTHLPIAQTGRFLVGLGSAFAFVGVLKLAALWLPPSRFALISGMTTALGMVGAMAGNIILAKLITFLGAQQTLVISTVVGIVLAFIIGYTIPDTSPISKVIPSSPELSYKEFLHEVWIVCKNPQMWSIGTVGCLLYLSLSAFGEAWGIPYLIRSYGLNNSTAANHISLVFLGWAIGGPVIGWISDKLSNRRQPIIIGAILGAILFSVVIYMPEVTRPFLGVFLLLFGICSSAQILVFPLARELNSQAVAATAIAVTNLFVMLGGALSQPLIGQLLDILSPQTGPGNLMAFSVHGFQYALTILPVAFLLAAILMLFIKKPQVVENSTEILPKATIDIRQYRE